MKINKFKRPEFGELTTITSEKTGKVMFIGKQVAKMWGHTNLRQAVNRLCNKDEFLVVSLKNHKLFKQQLVSNKLLQSSNAPSIMMISESAVYKLALASNLEKAKPFRDWVASEVLPSIRKNGYYSFANSTEKLMLNTNVAIQKNNSKEVNKKHFIEQGLEAVIEYNQQSCVLHTGKLPHEIIKEAKKKGLKSKDTSSAKQVLRATKPELACAMSFTDYLVKNGFDLKTVSELSMKAALPLFQGMIELGAIKNDLD